MTDPNQPSFEKQPQQPGAIPPPPQHQGFPPPQGPAPGYPPPQGPAPGYPPPPQHGFPQAPPPPNYPQPGQGQHFGPSAGQHPVQVWVHRADHQSRLLALFSIPFFLIRMIAAIPVVIVMYIVGIAFEIVAWIAMWAILFTGHYPEGMHNFTSGYLRWATRVYAWVLGLTDRYPGFGWAP